MKASSILLSLACSAIANSLGRREDDEDYDGVRTLTTYTSVTTCPVTSTYTEEGTTYCVTEWATSTITVTDCPECEQITTVPGPTITHTTTKEVEVTHETVSETDVQHLTKETTYTTTQTTIVSGSHVTKTYHTNHTTVEEAPTESTIYPTPSDEESGESPVLSTAAASPLHAPNVAFMAAMGGALALF